MTTSRATNDPVRAQAILRTAAWTQTLTGLVIVAAWMGSPTGVAEYVSIVAVLTGALFVGTRIALIRRGRHEV